MVRLVVIVDGEQKEGFAHCAGCARKKLLADPDVVWWEVFDLSGRQMLDSADEALEDRKPGVCRD